MSPKVDTTIRFSGLKSGIYEYHFDLTDEFFEAWKNDEIEGAEVHIDARMERMEHMLMFKFTLSGKLTTYCDRCLGALVLPVEGEEHLCVRFSDSEVVDDEEVVVLPETAFEIDIAQWLYEYVAVRIPLQHTHSEGDCDPDMVKRISSDEASAENTASSDPRWEALKTLK